MTDFRSDFVSFRILLSAPAFKARFTNHISSYVIIQDSFHVIFYLCRSVWYSQGTHSPLLPLHTLFPPFQLFVVAGCNALPLSANKPVAHTVKVLVADSSKIL